GCSNSSPGETVVYPVNDCLEFEDEILDKPSSSDAPKLYFGIGIESGDKSLNWSSISNTYYYELEECDCPNFSTLINTYTIEGNYFREFKYTGWSYYYRVKAITPDGETGYSKIIKYP
ncbi:MAG TPA: hypothetical protein VMT35_02685, partial [Ignavibacteriaceae bacterium]|nr:hypothetical protein [Ignavibacteriaceae bacterium]